MEQRLFFEELDQMFKSKNIKEIEDYIIHSMEKLQKDKDIPALLTLANELGGIYRVTNRFEEAKKIYGVANEAIKLLGLENTQQHGTTLLNLASVHSEAKEPGTALKLYEKVREIYQTERLDKDYRMAALYNNMSHVYEKLERQDKAIEYAEQSLDIIKGLSGYDVELATTYTTLASRYLRLGRYQDALPYLKYAEGIFTALPGKVNVHFAATLNSLGEVYYSQGESLEATRCFTKALEIIKENYGENAAYDQVSKNLSKAQAGIKQPNKRMTGMQLSQAYFYQYGKDMIDRSFSEYMEYMAVGLVGEGSECFGYDDDLSESHDFGPGFCIWLPGQVYEKIGLELQSAYNSLPKTLYNKTRIETPEGRGRVGVFNTGDFYKKYIGYPNGPKSNVEWLFTPETSLSTISNGKVFFDNLGEFTKIRNDLLGFYPRDVYLKKIVARMALMSQTGQYNYERCMKRGEYAAAYLACSEFVKTTVSMLYLLNKEYMPFYKWMFKGMDKFQALRETKLMLEQLVSITDVKENTGKKLALIEDICIKVRDELIRQKIINGSDAFLNSYCGQVMNQISDPQIRSLPVMFDGK